jgi:hypothetical protein
VVLNPRARSFREDRPPVHVSSLILTRLRVLWPTLELDVTLSAIE